MISTGKSVLCVSTFQVYLQDDRYKLLDFEDRTDLMINLDLSESPMIYHQSPHLIKALKEQEPIEINEKDNIFSLGLSSTFYQQLSRKEENTRAGLNVNIEKEKIVEIGKSENRSQMQHTAEFPYYRYQETKNVVNNIEPTKSYDYIDKALLTQSFNYTAEKPQEDPYKPPLSQSYQIPANYNKQYYSIYQPIESQNPFAEEKKEKFERSSDNVYSSQYGKEGNYEQIGC